MHIIFSYSFVNIVSVRVYESWSNFVVVVLLELPKCAVLFIFFCLKHCLYWIVMPQLLVSISNKAFCYGSFSFISCCYRVGLFVCFFSSCNPIIFLSIQGVFSIVPDIWSFPFSPEVNHQQLVDLLTQDHHVFEFVGSLSLSVCWKHFWNYTLKMNTTEVLNVFDD